MSPRVATQAEAPRIPALVWFAGIGAASLTLWALIIAGIQQLVLQIMEIWP
ncbi:hypothetical protein GXW78_27270 [Roseomonas terrae]|uniref:Uncharacterized protein n=1 Tax=Neoroseomonas terrae TaxID=424799 RepID=A0ABS5EQS0_9PROT|nr:hypothetical protein [Neoroseomonas terrae]MBR0653381.1 hypothetical protein [Neoroseomonas terrae]